MRIDAADPREVLRTYWGYDNFRGIQSDIIRSILTHHDTLGLMPTGAGKSIAFQVPALVLEGICIVVTPLIALMKDQVRHLRKRGIRAAAVYSGQSREEMLRHLDNAVLGGYEFLYVSPERLATDIFRTKLRKMQVGLITVDEAHCISQWGYDFRPPYLHIADIRRLLPGVPVLALTATATTEVVRDICRHLFLPEAVPTPTGEPPAGGEDIEGFRVYRMSFARPNLSYIVRPAPNKAEELLHILGSVAGSAIVYTRNRQHTREVSDRLNEAGITSLYYHAGLADADKDARAAAWTEGTVRVMVATNAFGMGIDKPDVRLVIHMDMPDSIEAYFQEAGRAGRDGQRAYAVLLTGREDRPNMLRRVKDTFPPKEYIRRVYEQLCDFFSLAMGDGYMVSYEFDEGKFCRIFRHFPTQLESAITLLCRAGYLDYRDEDEARSRVVFLVQRDALYRLNGLDRSADAVVHALLRTTCGLFSDYVCFEEATIAREANMSEQMVYETMKALSRQRVLDYIPRRRVPRITYLTRRVDTREIVLQAEVYEDRMRQYARRVEQMLDYAEQDEYCRSRFLLEYFSDFTGRDCGHCDVCIGRAGEADRTVRPREALRRLLSDGHPHRPESLFVRGVATDALQAALQEMTEAGEVVLEDGLFRLRE